MEKLWSKIKTFIKKYWIWCSIIFFAIGPLLLNLGLYFTDAIYDKFGYSLTARGLDNQDWLDFWGTYLSVLIAFVGICFAWKSSDEDRKKDKRERQAKEYGEHLEEEKHILTEICQSFNTDVVYKSLLELNNMEVQGCKRVLQSARERVLNAQVEFELLTDIAEGFHNCENCNFNPCYDKENMTAIRELYYKMERLYLELLQKCDTYLNSIVNTNRIEVQIRNNKNIISLLQQRIIYAKEISGTTSHDEIRKMEEEILYAESEIASLEEERIGAEELKELSDSIISSANLVSQNMKPELIRYSKSYIDWKKRHKEELLQEGKIKYVKYSRESEMLD